MSVSEPDISSIPEPRANPHLFGHEEAERVFLEAWRGDRLAHGWLLGGPRGIGKETLAFRMARFVLAGGQSDSLALDSTHPVFRRVAAGGHSDLFCLSRQINEKTGKLRGEIVIEDARRLGGFLALTPGEGAWRVAIVDGAEEMNRNAANALLKALEEPSPRTLLVLVSHAPGRLLPTIRSRCRFVPMRPIDDMALRGVLKGQIEALPAEDAETLVALANGSPGRAIALNEAGGVSLYRDLVALLATLPALDATKLHALADSTTAGEGRDGFKLVGELLLSLLARLARPLESQRKLLEAAEAALKGGLLGSGASLDQWVEVWDNLRRLFARADAIDLDPRQALIGAFSALKRVTRS